MEMTIELLIEFLSSFVRRKEDRANGTVVTVHLF